MPQIAINRFLNRVGMNPKGEPLFKLTWSDTELELRRGQYNEFYGSIFLRQAVGVREVPKYPYIKSRWVLERWSPPNPVLFDELPLSTKGTYEPIYVFEDAKGKALPLSLPVVELIVNTILNPIEGNKQRLVETLCKQEEKQEQDDMDSIDTSWLQNSLHQKEAVGYGTIKR